MLDPGELERLHEIDRAEVVRLLYTYRDGDLEEERVALKVPPWTEEKVGQLIRDIGPELDGGGAFLGAFMADVLAGVAVLGNRPVCGDEKMLQMVFLHVDRNHRRKGIARGLLEEVKRLARERGASRLYISATPSDSAIGFYMSGGCKLAPKVDKELYAKEPEDIHLVLDL